MDSETKKILDLINSHSKIKKYLTVGCYFMIIGGIFGYVFHIFNHESKHIKLVTKYSQDSNRYRLEKIMTNPRITFQHGANEIYQIKAKKASHINNEEILMFDVSALGNIGKITAGELKIDEKGDHLTFSKNPILILNKTND